MESQDCRDCLDRREKLDILEGMDLREISVPRDLLEAALSPTDPQDPLVFPVAPETLDLLELTATPVSQDLTDPPASLEALEPPVFPEWKDSPELRVIRENLAILELLECLDLREISA